MNIQPQIAVSYRNHLKMTLLIAAALVFSACTTQAVTPVPLPTAEVPSALEINNAISRWEAGNNRSYFISVEESTHAGTFLYRIVIADGEIRAAQRSERSAGEWQPPVALDAETAQSYTVDALLARVQQDAGGLGSAPLNMFVIFDQLSGFPSLVEAKGLPSYTNDGGLLLNREYGYIISVSVDVLLEEVIGFNKTPILTLYRSGGDQAWCSTLRIFTDGSSIYTDDCRQILLQLKPPQNRFERLEALAVQLAPTDDERVGENETSRFILHAGGEESAGAETIDEIWDLAFDLNDLLSKPIGAGVTLLRVQSDALVGFDMRTNLEQPATLDFTAPFHGGIFDRTGQRLIFSDSSGLKWLDTVSGQTGTYFSNPENQWYVPVGTTGDGRILLKRFTENEDTVEWGWSSTDERGWHDLPEVGSCITGLSGSPLDARVAVSTRSDAGCGSDAALWIVDLETGTAEPLIRDPAGATGVAWSPGGERLAVILDETTLESTGPFTRLYLVQTDGSGLTQLTGNSRGQVNGVVWGARGASIYYGISGADTEEDGLVEYDLGEGSSSRSLSGTGLAPVRFDPTGEFLAFNEGEELRVWLVSFGQVIPITQGNGADSTFIGWAQAGGGN